MISEYFQKTMADIEGQPTRQYPVLNNQQMAPAPYPAQPQPIQPAPSAPQEPAPIIIQVHEREPAVNQNALGIAPMLYAASCALFFIPFGWIFAIIAMCWYSNLRRQHTYPEKRAYRFLSICVIINFVLTILLLIFTSR